MNNSYQSFFGFLQKRHLLLLVQFFLITFAYHTLKDMKDSVVITASDAGAQVIPFIKIWGMLPASIGASFLFVKLYNYFGREKTTYFLVSTLLTIYTLFAFVLYPFREILYLGQIQDYLSLILPAGCKGFIAMISFWHYTLFYLAAELWSPMVLSIIFWGYVNEVTNLEEAKNFYPICMLTGNFAGILSGFTSHWLCHQLKESFSWQQTTQFLIIGVVACGLAILAINRLLSLEGSSSSQIYTKKSSKSSFKESVMNIFQSTPLLCITAIVFGYGLTSNLIEVVWKENLRNLHPEPQAYNAYMNQLTSIIGLLAVIMALISKYLFKYLSWKKTALITPITLFITSLVFFTSLLLPKEHLSWIASSVSLSPLYLTVLLGSIHYSLAMTAKYTLFDSCKEMAFLSVGSDDRLKAKSVIDSVGSRLGKSGSSCLLQFLLIFFGTTAGHLSIIAITCIFFIGISIFATKKLGLFMTKSPKECTEGV